MGSLNDRFKSMNIMSPPSKVGLVENNRWKKEASPTYRSPISSGKEHLPLKSKNTKINNHANEPRRDSDSNGHGGETWHRCPESSGDYGKPPQRVHTVELIGGLDIELAMKLHNGCITDGSMLQPTLDRIGFRGSLEDENSNIRGISCYKVAVRKSCIVTNGISHNSYAVVLDLKREMLGRQKFKLLDMFAKHQIAGFIEWLGGAKGWRYDCAKTERVSWKRRFVVQLNTLQSVFKLFAGDELYFFADEKKRMVWRKHDELTEIVSDVRVWIERINAMRQSNLTRQLLRNSSIGPDSPLHWAHHHPQTDYPLTVVSEATMMTLVEGIIKLFKTEFHHSESDPLGKRWRSHEKRRLTDWKEAANVCPEWTECHLEELLN